MKMNLEVGIEPPPDRGWKRRTQGLDTINPGQSVVVNLAEANAIVQMGRRKGWRMAQVKTGANEARVWRRA